MKRFASLATTAALAGALIGVGSASHASSNTINLYLVPISSLTANYAAGASVSFAALIDVPATAFDPITLTIGATIGYDSVKDFDINSINGTPDTSAYPPKPSVHLWDLVPPTAYSSTVTGPGGGAPLDTYQVGVGHTRQTIQPGNKVTSIPGGTYTVATFTFPLLHAVDSAHPASVLLPSAFNLGGTNSAIDFINSTNSTGTNLDVLAFPNGNGKFNKLTFSGASAGTETPAPSSLLVLAMGALPVAGILRRRAAKK